MFEGATSEKTVHAEQAAAALGLPVEKVGQGASVKARDANDGLKTANGQNHQGEEDPRLEFRDLEAIAESIGKGGKHRWKSGRLKAKGQRAVFDHQFNLEHGSHFIVFYKFQR